ncbi:bublin coiled-coil protein isoform 1-T1 [Trichechus inunguis]|uniref:Bublin coiled-coil protein isoform X1 n=1 Tax=Trichechus manatus latirostris TaxID=127582 RepID=A0A2Y9QWR8_TRIMA|nr:bublin coiled-coil protein isoform X1 [Trichechus manatus latirostris]
MSGPNGDLGMPVEAGAEGEDDGFGEAGDREGQLKLPLPLQGCPPGDGNWGQVWSLEGTEEPSSLPSLEYAAINSMLDQINSCLDHLEEKNDHLHARLQELLESNRQTRLEFQQQLGEASSDATH